MKILFAGEGGQGIQVIAEILAKASFLEGKHALYIPNFGVEQRGGVSLAFVVVDEDPVVYPKFEKADILAIMTDRSIERIKSYIDSRTKIILSPTVTEKVKPDEIKVKADSFPAKIWNIVVLGKINQVGQIVSQNNLVKAMEERFAKQFQRTPELKELDLQALRQK